MSAGRLNIAILGGGSWGTTLAQLCALAGHRVRLWMRNGEVIREVLELRTNRRYAGPVTLSDSIDPTDDLGWAVRDARLVLLVVPSSACETAVRERGTVVPADQIGVHATKGLELDTGKAVSRILHEETGIRKLGVLSGPNIAPEILAGLPAAPVVASHYPEVVEVAQAAL